MFPVCVHKLGACYFRLSSEWALGGIPCPCSIEEDFGSGKLYTAGPNSKSMVCFRPIPPSLVKLVNSFSVSPQWRRRRLPGSRSVAKRDHALGFCESYMSLLPPNMPVRIVDSFYCVLAYIPYL